uniref:Uncharacterized protein n=1 Tax=Caenorhabditis japonica TaxID=281687 RepID=A0A8R1DY79_CAEJA
MKWDLEKCYGTEVSSVWKGCKTEIIGERIYTGCMNASDWHTNFLCSPLQQDRVYDANMDSLGILMYDRTRAWCCREPLCNNYGFFYHMNSPSFQEDSTGEAQFLSDMTIFMVFLISMGFYMAYQAFQIKPIFNRRDPVGYMCRRNAERKWL